MPTNKDIYGPTTFINLGQIALPSAGFRGEVPVADTAGEKARSQSSLPGSPESVRVAEEVTFNDTLSGALQKVAV